MTTRIHIVNFGPDTIEIEQPTSTPNLLVTPQASVDFYIYGEEPIKITEKKQAEKKNV